MLKFFSCFKRQRAYELQTTGVVSESHASGYLLVVSQGLHTTNLTWWYLPQLIQVKTLTLRRNNLVGVDTSRTFLSWSPHSAWPHGYRQAPYVRAVCLFPYSILFVWFWIVEWCCIQVRTQLQLKVHFRRNQNTSKQQQLKHWPVLVKHIFTNSQTL